MRITLMRHGRPAVQTGERLSPRGFAQWVEQYDEAGVVRNEEPPAEAIKAAHFARFVVCSDLQRSVSSAKLLGCSVNVADPLFREAEMPVLDGSFPRLSPRLWSVIFRLAWVCGFKSGVEALSDARKRADRCAQQLCELAGTHEDVLLVGHGTFLWLIARRLSRLGWNGPTNTPRHHWSFGTWESA